MPCYHPAKIKATLHTARGDEAGLIQEGGHCGSQPETALLTLPELINQSQILHTEDGLGPIKGFALRWGQTEIYVAYIKRPFGGLAGI